MAAVLSAVTFLDLTRFTDVALLLLRVMVGLVFLTSGWNHLRDPAGRSKDRYSGIGGMPHRIR